MPAVAEFEVAGAKYRGRPMDSRVQFHIALKFAAVAASFSDMTNPAQAIGRLSTDDADLVINSCLSVIEREVPGGAAWAPIMTPDGIIMFDDVRTSLAALIQIVIPVIEANARDFFLALPKEFIASLAGRLGGLLTNS